MEQRKWLKRTACRGCSGQSNVHCSAGWRRGGKQDSLVDVLACENDSEKALFVVFAMNHGIRDKALCRVRQQYSTR